MPPRAFTASSAFLCSRRGALCASVLVFFAIFMIFGELKSHDHLDPNIEPGGSRTFMPGYTLRPTPLPADEYEPLPRKANENIDGSGGGGGDDLDETLAPPAKSGRGDDAAPQSAVPQGHYPFRAARLAEERRAVPDPEITEWPHEDELLDKPIYNFTTSRLVDSSSSSPRKFISKLEWKGKCWYEVSNFCIVGGDLVLYHDPSSGSTVRRDSLRMCTEFSQRSPLIRLKYRSEPMPAILPGPLLEKTPGWVLQFWCQDLFHSTLSLMPAFQTKLKYFANTNPDIYLRIARGRRKKGQYCHIKYGHPLTFNESHNKRWGGDKQFPFAGNPYWSMYGVLSKDPWRFHPLYGGGATKKTACYRRGIIDKLYVKDVSRRNARDYSDAMLENLNVTKAKRRQCGKYRVTIIDRRGKTRRLTNIPAIVDVAKNKVPGFVEVRAVAFEFLTLQQQISLITDTDLLLGMHGNGLIWQQFLQQGSSVIELCHTWYMPYAKLFGHSYFHSSLRHNPIYKQQGEFVPFAHNETEIGELLGKAKEALDRTTCGEKPEMPDMEQRLDYMYAGCAPHC